MLGGALAVERFERAVLTAIQRDPDLLTFPRDSLVSAGLKAAQDRLLPDGREGAFVVRWNSKARRKEVTWAPMVYGIVKVAKQYAGVRSLSCEIVYEGEPFRILMGDEMRIEHERVPACVASRQEVGCYAIAILGDGDRVREFMTASEIRQVEECSESAKKGIGPWKAWRGEMMRKSVIRRLAKRLPALDEGGEALRRVIERVDEDYDFGRPALVAVAEPQAERPVIDPAALVSASAFGLEALDDQLGQLSTAECVRGYLGQPALQAWLARLRRTRPEQAAQADTIIAATWARVRTESREDGADEIEEDEVTSGSWVIVGSAGNQRFASHGEWLEAWGQRVAAIEAASRPVEVRRAVLERMLALNSGVFRHLQRTGCGSAVLEAQGISAAADGRLANAAALPVAAE